MANYNESAVAGTSWTRAAQLIIDNPHGGSPSIRAVEEQIAVFEDGKYARMANFSLPIIWQELTPANAESEFPLLNPETLEALGTTAKYQDLAVLITSLYVHLAKERDLALERGPQPYPSWVWSAETASWVAPIPQPESGDWVWNEALQEWMDMSPQMSVE